RRISARTLQHRSGFPDFMDLLVVCADSGLSLEASFERVGREIGQGYPSLSANIHLTNLEVRAGRALKEALENFADRLALEEARAFATLINQSDELGSSISDALRVYSDDMRHKRLSRAEEKAYSPPAKLPVPMMVCIFPVLFVVILCPVIVRMVTGTWCARPPRQTRHGPARGLPSRSSPSLARPVLSGRWPGRPIRAWGGGIRAGCGPERVMSIRVARILIVGAACLMGLSACSTAPKLNDETASAAPRDGGVTGILSDLWPSKKDKTIDGGDTTGSVLTPPAATADLAAPGGGRSRQPAARGLWRGWRIPASSATIPTTTCSAAKNISAA